MSPESAPACRPARPERCCPREVRCSRPVPDSGLASVEASSRLPGAPREKANSLVPFLITIFSSSLLSNPSVQPSRSHLESLTARPGQPASRTRLFRPVTRKDSLSFGFSHCYVCLGSSSMGPASPPAPQAKQRAPPELGDRGRHPVSPPCILHHLVPSSLRPGRRV